MGMDLKDEDYIEHLFVASTHDYVLFFTTVGKVYRLKVHELRSARASRRAARSSTCSRSGRTSSPGDRDARLQGRAPLFATKAGVVKKTEFLEYNTPLKADGIIAIKLREDDELVGVRLSTGRRRPDGLLAAARRSASTSATSRPGPRRVGRQGHGPARGGRGDRARHRPRRHRSARRDRAATGRAGLRLPGQGPGRARRQDDPAHRRARHARRRPRRPRRLPGDADLHRWHRDPDPGRRGQAARPLDAGRDRDAPARR